MLRSPSAWLALAAAACAAGPAPPAGGPTPPQPTWQRTMKQVERQIAIVEHELGQRPPGDLRAAAEAATAAADLLRHGYGAFEDPRVPGFARLARDAESWLLQVALEARQAHGDLAIDLFAHKQRHCTRCHDAAKVRPW